MNSLHLISCFLVAQALFSLHTVAQDDPSQDCLGCKTPANKSDPRILKYAEDAVEEIQKESNCTGCTYELDILVTATTQVVAGELLHFDLTVKKLFRIGAAMVFGHEICSVDIWLKEWENYENITIKYCVEFQEISVGQD